MTAAFDQLLKDNSVFSSLDENARSLILPLFVQVNLSAKEILFYQGDPSDSVYLLISGRLAAQLTSGTGKKRTVGYIENGETVGELGALSGEVRSLTIQAVKDSVLLKLSTPDFLSIVHQHPAVMFAVMRPVVSRSISLIQVLSREQRSKHIVIVPANLDISLEKFSEKFYEIVEKFPKTLVISDYHPNFSDKNVSTTVIKEKIQRLIEARKSKHRIVYILSSFATPLAKLAFKHMDMLYITTYANTPPTIDHFILEIIEHRNLHFHLKPNLVILHRDGASSPLNTLHWLDLYSFGLHHHIRMNVTKDFQRLFRFIRGKAVGLVLGGGGTRGWAHIGAIRAIREENIPIDIIGGTSVGAIIAGIYAMDQSHEHLYKKFGSLVDHSRNSINWRSLTWPLVSLFNAEKFTNAQIDLFGEERIENLWLPYFCITSNLASNTEDIQQSGLLWEKIRASTSLPGLIPPMLLNGELHLDGGLLNNLPVDVMRQYIGDRGRVIAIELNDMPLEKNKYQFPPIMKFKDILYNKLGLNKNNYNYPPFIDTFLQGLFLGSLLRSRENALAANIFVSLNLAQFRMLYATSEEGDSLVQLGYDETIKQIKKTKNKNILPG